MLFLMLVTYKTKITMYMLLEFEITLCILQLTNNILYQLNNVSLLHIFSSSINSNPFLSKRVSFQATNSYITPSDKVYLDWKVGVTQDCWRPGAEKLVCAVPLSINFPPPLPPAPISSWMLPNAT